MTHTHEKSEEFLPLVQDEDFKSSPRASSKAHQLWRGICTVVLIVLCDFGVRFLLSSCNNKANEPASNPPLSTGIIGKLDVDHSPEPTLDHSSCSCYNTTSTQECCQRYILYAHKFGTVWTRTLGRHWSGMYGDEKELLHGDFEADVFLPASNTRSQTAPDHRHVGIVRNIFDAMVSGYTYHKSGMECWLSLSGKPKKKEKVIDWPEMRQYEGGAPFPPRNNRSICRYLADESEEDGMRVFIDFSLSTWYNGLIPYWNEVQRRFDASHEQRSLLVCFEDLFSDTATQDSTFHTMLDWMYPSGHNYTYPLLEQEKDGGRSQEEMQTEKKEHHSSSHDPEVRRRLLELVHALDKTVFRDDLAAMEARFPCGKTKK